MFSYGTSTALQACPPTRPSAMTFGGSETLPSPAFAASAGSSGKRSHLLAWNLSRRPTYHLGRAVAILAPLTTRAPLNGERNPIGLLDRYCVGTRISRRHPT